VQKTEDIEQLMLRIKVVIYIYVLLNQSNSLAKVMAEFQEKVFPLVIKSDNHSQV